MNKSQNFVQNVGFLTSWNIISSAINFIIFYLITNFLGPTEYGKYAIVLTIISTTSLALHASINNALHRFSALTQDKNLIKYCLKVQFLLNLIVFVIISSFSWFISKVYNKPLTILFIIISATLLFTPYTEIAKNFFIGRINVKKFSYVAAINQLILLLGIMCTIIFGLDKAVYIAIAYLIAQLITFLYSHKIINKQDYIEGGYNKKELNTFIKDGILYGIFKSAYLQMAIIIGGIFISLEQAAFYSFSFSIGMASIMQITNSIQTMLTPYTSPLYNKKYTKKNKKTIEKYFNAGIKSGLIINAIISIFIYAFLKITISYLFPKYALALNILPYFLLTFIIMNFLTPASFLKAKGKMKSLTKWAIITTILSIINSYIWSKIFGFKGVIIAFFTNTLIAIIILWYYSYKDLKLKLNLIPSKEEICYTLKYLKLIYKKLYGKFFINRR